MYIEPSCASLLPAVNFWPFCINKVSMPSGGKLHEQHICSPSRYCLRAFCSCRCVDGAGDAGGRQPLDIFNGSSSTANIAAHCLSNDGTNLAGPPFPEAVLQLPTPVSQEAPL